MLEYEEVTTRLSGKDRWRDIVILLDLLAELHGNIRRVEPQFRFKIIAVDPDDNKFSDCAIAAEAEFVVTEDRHFDALKSAGYKSQPMAPEGFVRLILDREMQK